MLDLEYVGAQLRQKLPDLRASQHTGQLQDAQAGERRRSSERFGGGKLDGFIHAANLTAELRGGAAGHSEVNAKRPAGLLRRAVIAGLQTQPRRYFIVRRSPFTRFDELIDLRVVARTGRLFVSTLLDVVFVVLVSPII